MSDGTSLMSFTLREESEKKMVFFWENEQHETERKRHIYKLVSCN